MYEYIPSKAVKKYMEFKKMQLTDFEKASFIYNVGTAYGIEKQHDCLKEIMNCTQNKTLRQQIAERLEEDEKNLAAFLSNMNKAIYKVQFYYEDGSDFDYEQYFSTFEMASECAREYMQQGFPDCQKYEITKHPLYRGKQKPLIDEDGWEASSLLGYALFNSFGKLTELFSYEYQDRFGDWDNKRFESYYMASFRNPFRTGDIVKDLTNGQYGVVAVGDDDYNYEKMKRLAKRGHADIDSNRILVEYLYDNGGALHNHPYPWDLEYTHLQFNFDICSSNIMEAMLCSMSEMVQGQGYIEIMQDKSEKMAKMETSAINNAKEELESRYAHFVQSKEYDEILSKHFAALENK